MPRKSFMQRLGEDIVDEVIQQTLGVIFKPKPTKFCIYCGNGITPGSGRRTFCSDMCSNLSRKTKMRISPTKFCKNCGNGITPGSGRRTWCSDHCARENTLNKRSGKKAKLTIFKQGFAKVATSFYQQVQTSAIVNKINSYLLSSTH